MRARPAFSCIRFIFYIIYATLRIAWVASGFRHAGAFPQAMTPAPIQVPLERVNSQS
jgi:hypothetical protein